VIITDHDLDRQCHLRKISLMFVSFFIFVQLVKRFCLQALASVAGSPREGIPCWLCEIGTTVAHNGDILAHHG
jgi:hypothetical protein